MKTTAFLHFVLGAWLGGSIIMGAVIAYNFAGFEDLFERNPKLAAHAGFTIADVPAKKASLLWVHSSELNRALFERWNRTQLAIGVVAMVLALAARARWAPTVLLALATMIVACAHFFVGTQLVELGRQLDFVVRVPPPPQLELFQQKHGLYFALESVRVSVLAVATLWLLLSPPRKPSPSLM